MKLYTAVTIPTQGGNVPPGPVLSHDLISRSGPHLQWLGLFLSRSSRAGWDFEQSTDASNGILFIFSRPAPGNAGGAAEAAPVLPPAPALPPAPTANG